MGEPTVEVKAEDVNEDPSTENKANGEKSIDNLSTDLNNVQQDNDEGENDDTKDLLDDSKAEDDEHDNEKSDPAAESIINTSLCLRIVGFKRPQNLEEELKKYHKYFTKAVGVEAPLVEIPGPDDKWIYFEMKSLEDRDKVIAFAKKGPWESQRLFPKIVAKPTNEIEDMKKLTVDEGLKILYPEKDTLYSKQLKTKYQAAKEVIEKIIPKNKVEKIISTKKYLKSALRVREIVPMVPVDGYARHTTLFPEKDETTGKISYGVRVLSAAKDAYVIVPLEDCISIPREMKLVAKELIPKLPNYDLLPHLRTKENDGDVLALSLRMSSYGSFMLTVIIPKVFPCIYRQLSEDGVQLEENEELLSAQLKKKLDEVKAKIGKFYTEVGKEFSVDSVYLGMAFHHLITQYSLVTIVDGTNPTATHIFGQKLLPDKLNGITLRVSWDHDQHVEVFEPLLSLIEEQGQINSSSRVYLVSPYRLVGLYLAKKCAHVTMFYSWTRDNLNEYNQWAKQLGYKNIEFFSARSHLKKLFPNQNAAVIFWQFSKPTLLDRFIKSEVYNMTFISYCNKPSATMYYNTQKALMETAYSNLRISYICPFDLAPFKDKFGVAVFFNKNRFNANEPTQKKKIERGKFNFRREGKSFGVAARLTESSQISPFKRLGPVPFSRGRTFESGSINRSDPWIDQSHSKAPGSALRQLDEVASDVMHNLHAVQQQMQAFIPSLMGNSQQQPPPAPPVSHESSGWSNKRRYNEDFTEDTQYNRWKDNSYSSYDGRDFKRRREDYSYNDNYQSNDNSIGRWNQKETWGGGNSGSVQQNQSSTYGEPPQSWGNNSHAQEPPYYEKGRNTTTSAWLNNTNRSNYY